MCADAAVEYYSAILADRRASAAARETALKYVVHLVGDLHQPLHGSDPVGYNRVRRGLRVESIHAVWDNAIVEDHGKSYSELAREWDEDDGPVPLGGTPRIWAEESSAAARAHIYDMLPPCFPARRPFCPVLQTLPAHYTTTHYPLAAQRMKQAGLRLAALLDKILP